MTLGLAMIVSLAFGNWPATAGESSPDPAGGGDPGQEPPPAATITIHHPPPGAVRTAPARIVFEATAVDPAGDIRLVEFFANDQWIGRSEFLAKIAVIPGNPIPHRLVWESVPAGKYAIVARAVDSAGNKVASETRELRVLEGPAPTGALVKRDAIWRYSNDGTDLGVAWREPAFDDSAWLQGPAELGYGDGDEATLTRKAGKPNPITAYFRHTFEVTDPRAIPALLLRLVRDDGAAVYLNGREVLRDAMPEGELAFTTLASATAGTDENAFHAFKLPATGLTAGLNVLAVEVHQANAESSDLSFALELLPGEPPPLTALEIVEPAGGSTHPADQPLTIVALAVGWEGPLEFFAGDRSLGKSVSPGATPDAGEAVKHRFVWEDPPAGIHVLTARTLPDAAGSVVSSVPVRVTVEGTVSDRPLVRIEATVPETVEPSPETRIRPAMLRISRQGDLTPPLAVVCLLGGSATVNQDYLLQPAPGDLHTFTIPAGAEAVEVLVAALDDDLVEGAETVMVELSGFPFGAPLPDPYEIDPEARAAKIVIHDNEETSAEASLVLSQPKPGAAFRPGEEIAILATAMDPAGYIARVEFFAGEDLLGVSEIAFLVAPEPGTPIEHAFNWKGAPVDIHVLSARALTSAGEKVVSGPVRVTVGEAARRVILAVEATDSKAHEPLGTTTADVGVFTIKRVAGPAEVEVTVFYSLLGTARDGVDYLPLREHAVLAAGAESTRVVVTPLADELVERPETVALRLEPPVCPAIEPPPPGCYLVGEPAEATIQILDGDPDGNLPPRVSLLAPQAGDVFKPGEAIIIAAEASDPDGSIARLEVRAGDRVLGSAAEGSLKFEWNEATPGVHVLTAGAVDNAGAGAVSTPVRILVREAAALSFVHRELPPAYAAGHAFTVVLGAAPPRRGIAYAIEDQPPAGWVVSDISDDGAFDRAHGEVKFGPFTDREVRRFSYRVTPPTEATGRQEFTGTASLDGTSSPILGDTVVEPAGEFHPAEVKPQDHGIAVDELTAYAAAWKAGHSWPAGAGSIPLSFVTRAGAIWRAGEEYVFKPEEGAPPLCWVPSPPKPGLAGIEAGDGDGRADREAAGNCVAGAESEVRVRIEPPAGTRAWAVEEIVPAGWAVSELGEGGEFDAASRRLRWGLFLGDSARTLRYQLVAPEGVASLAALAGVASFDGHDRLITGGRESLALPAGKELRIHRVQRRADGHVLLRLGGQANQLVIVETSADLRHWTEVRPVLLTGDETDCEDAAAGEAPRFYRLRPVGQ